MGHELKLRVYFPPGGELDALCQERRRVKANAERVAEHYAAMLKEMDERIAELRAKEAING